MANSEQISYLKKGVDYWNSWRRENPSVVIDFADANLQKLSLSNVDLRQANLRNANLYQTDLQEARLNGADLTLAVLGEANLYKGNLIGANLRDTKLQRANLEKAKLGSVVLRWAQLNNTNLSGANLNQADMRNIDLTQANLSQAKLSEADLSNANLIQADLSNSDIRHSTLRCAKLHGVNLTDANLFGSDLTEASLVGSDCSGVNFSMAMMTSTDLQKSRLVNCRVYGASAWDLNLQGAVQRNIIVTQQGEAEITVDDLEVAQFIYLILNRDKLRNIINTINTKAVLILGRFTPERKVVLDLVAEELRKNNLLPIIFDFQRPTGRDFTETIKVLAGMSLFVIVDITNPKSSPLELQATIPDYQIPFVPIIQEGEKPFSMFNDLINKYHWVLQPIQYSSLEQLRQKFKVAIIDRAWDKHLELSKSKGTKFELLSLNEFLN
jgi:uncharacterized protein YjbI with pentapeptide repeats